MFLLSGKRKRPEIAHDKAGCAGSGKADGLSRDRIARAQPEASEDSHEGGADGGQIAEQAFGIAHVVIGRVEVQVIREEMTVDPGDEVLCHVHEGNVAARHADARNGNPPEEDPIADERHSERYSFGGGALIPEIEQANDEITDGDALQHAVEAHVTEREEREVVDYDTENDQDCGALQSMLRELRRVWRRGLSELRRRRQ